MMFYNLFDSHTHSDNSFDAVHSVMFLCEAAIKRGLAGIAITDHCDVNRNDRLHYLQRLRQSHFEVYKARAAFGQGFSIASGIEIAQPSHNYAFADQMLESVAFDFVIGAVHSAGGWGDPHYCDFTQDDPYAVLEDYFTEMLLLVQWGKFDALAHLEYPMRYICRDGRWDVSLDRFEEPIDACLRLLAEQGKALEIDTSGLRGRMARVQPQLHYLRRFRDLGGEIVTIGSDAHRAEEIGFGIEDGMELAREAGFSYIGVYKQRQARMMHIF